MTHPLIDTLAKTPGAELVSADTLDAFLAARSDCLTLLFFAGHGANKLETPDVAVVLIELLKLFGDKIRVAVIDEASERELMGRCAVLMLPSISIFHGDKHLKTIAKIQDWEVYAGEMPTLLSAAGLDQSAHQ